MVALKLRVNCGSNALTCVATQIDEPLVFQWCACPVDAVELIVRYVTYVVPVCMCIVYVLVPLVCWCVQCLK
jgi:hypothetical protein